MSKIINGKQSIKTKPESVYLTDDSVFGDASDIPASIKADMNAKGLVPRWLNAIQMRKTFNMHKKGWQVYKVPAELSGSILGGINPDGVVVRDDLVLGYKTKEQHATHKALLQQKANRSSQLQHGKELRQMAANAGIKTVIDETDDD